jgi:hypothetical protein
MADTVLVKPWPGLILDGIPQSGAELPRALAEEWLANRLVMRVPQPQTPAPVGKPINTAVRARKQRRTRGK